MRTSCAPALLAALLLALPAGAEPPPETAETLFVRARALMKHGDCVGALPLLEQSHAIEPTVGTRFNMAICEERLGKLTQALEHLRSVIDASAPDDDRRTHAERELRELLPRIPSLVVELDDAHQGLELVRLDGEALPNLRANEPFAINPGPHELEVLLTGEAPQIRHFSVVERQVYTWSVGGMTAAPMVGSVGLTTPTTGELNDATTTPSSAPPESIWTPQRKAAVVAAGTSLAAFGVATGFAMSARSIYDSSDDNCGANDVCDDEGVEARDRARVHGNVATVAVTVGIVSALAAGTLWFTGAPRPPSPSKPVRVGLQFNAGRAPGGGVVLAGSY